MADLRDLGLSEYEARAYRTLLAMGPSTARKLSNESGVPMGRIYDVLNDLETHGLTRSQTASRPKTYVAVEPDDALDRLLEVRERELEATAEQYAETVAELKADLEAGAVEGDGFWTAAVGPEEVLDLLTERIETADERIVMVAGPVSAGFDLGEVGSRITDHLEAAAERGVAVRVLAAYELASDLPPALGERYATLIEDHDSFSVRVGSETVRAVTVVDQEVCVEVPNPIDPERAFAMIDVTDRQFANEVTSAVEEEWPEATPL
jgi:sugar-specific transcriptional regulator TrmB